MAKQNRWQNGFLRLALIPLAVQIPSSEKKLYHPVRLITTAAYCFCWPKNQVKLVQTPVQGQEGSDSSLIKEKKRPFYTTKKGIIIIALALLVIITVAVVGGVVGSRKRNNNGSPFHSVGQGIGSTPSPTPLSSLGGPLASFGFKTSFTPLPTPSPFRTAKGWPYKSPVATRVTWVTSISVQVARLARRTRVFCIWCFLSFFFLLFLF